eukprot:13948-Heterococcus_DN1.PRE.4
MDAAATQDMQVLLLAEPSTVAAASSTAAQQSQHAPAATVTATAAASASNEHYVLVRTGYSNSGVTAANATATTATATTAATTAADSNESSFAPLQVLEEIRLQHTVQVKYSPDGKLVPTNGGVLKMLVDQRASRGGNRVYICYHNAERRNLTVNVVELAPFQGNVSTAGTATAAATTSTAATDTTTAAGSSAVQSPSSGTSDTGSSKPQQMCLDFEKHTGECLGIGAPQGGGLLIFGKHLSAAAKQYCIYNRGWSVPPYQEDRNTTILWSIKKTITAQ